VRITCCTSCLSLTCFCMHGFHFKLFFVHPALKDSPNTAPVLQLRLLKGFLLPQPLRPPSQRRKRDGFTSKWPTKFKTKLCFATVACLRQSVWVRVESVGRDHEGEKQQPWRYAFQRERKFDQAK